jgi:hypothetical protein
MSPLTSEQLASVAVSQTIASRQALLDSIAPIRGVLSDLCFTASAPGNSADRLNVRIGCVVAVEVLAHFDVLDLSVYVGMVPATAENYATLLSHNDTGPWWYRIGDLTAEGLVSVERVYRAGRRDAERLDLLILDGWRQYWMAQGLLEVLNGTFDAR